MHPLRKTEKQTKTMIWPATKSDAIFIRLFLLRFGNKKNKKKERKKERKENGHEKEYSLVLATR